MNINERIDWRPGMEITAKTFLELDNNLARKLQLASRTVNGNQFGIIPFTELKVKGGFVRNKLEIDGLACMALLPSGKILHVNEDVAVSVPLVYGDVYYLACGFGEEVMKYDIDTVPMRRLQHTFGIYPMEELVGTDLFPLMKFQVKDGAFSIDENYILPCLHLTSDERFKSHLDQLAEKMTVLADHPNLESGEGKRAFRHFAFLLQHYDLNSRTQQLLQLTVEMAQAVEYYAVAPNTEHSPEMPECNAYDIVLWLKWLDSYLHSAATILDKVVLEDHSIDFDELKRQTKEELYAQLFPELKEALYNELKPVLYDEISNDVLMKITEYVNNRLKEDLHGLLSGELSEELYTKLYDALYAKLYEALYVPEEEEEEEVFMPII